MIVVGYTADQYGQAALEHAMTEASVRGTGLLVVNSTKGDAYVDPAFAGQLLDRHVLGYLIDRERENGDQCRDGRQRAPTAPSACGQGMRTT